MEPPRALRSGLKSAGAITGVTFCGQPVLISTEKRWVQGVILDAGAIDPHSEPRAPRVSAWYILIDSTYPLGSITVVPAKKDGLTATFPHQRLNRPGDDSKLWRTGALCLDTAFQQVGGRLVSQDPVGDKEGRLRWHLERALDWIRAAASIRLVLPGDPFEIPAYPVAAASRLVHEESTHSFSVWRERRPPSWGLVSFSGVIGLANAFQAQAYFRPDYRLLRSAPKYDPVIHNPRLRDERTGFWWLWPAPIVVAPWKAPETWGELRAIGRQQGIDVDQTLRQIAQRSRESATRFLLLGYAIPTHYGEPPTEIFWQAVELPRLSKYLEPPDGFRCNDAGYWERDRTSHFGSNEEIRYVVTENWHPDRMQARGRFAPHLRDCRTLIIGCGALGAAIADLLVRGGVKDLVLMDPEVLGPENLVRHPLSGYEIGKYKASALAERLATVSLNASVTAKDTALPLPKTELEKQLDPFDLILDCTASLEVLWALQQGSWSRPRYFISLSVGYRARRLFLLAHRGGSLPGQALLRCLQPTLDEERAQWELEGEVLQGAGCWSPVFPARLDDILMAAAGATKLIEELVETQLIGSRIIMMEQTGEGLFSGVRRIELDCRNADDI